MTNLDSILKSRDTPLSTKACIVKAMVFSSSHVWMWELDPKKGWVPKNRCFWTVVLDKTIESSLEIKEIKPINPKENQPWLFIRRTDDETPILWPPAVKSHLFGKDPDGKDWGQQQNGETEDEGVNDITDSMTMSLSKPREIQGSLVCSRVAKSWTRLSNWITKGSENVCSFVIASNKILIN